VRTPAPAREPRVAFLSSLHLFLLTATRRTVVVMCHVGQTSTSEGQDGHDQATKVIAHPGLGCVYSSCQNQRRWCRIACVYVSNVPGRDASAQRARPARRPVLLTGSRSMKGASSARARGDLRSRRAAHARVRRGARR